MLKMSKRSFAGKEPKKELPIFSNTFKIKRNNSIGQDTYSIKKIGSASIKNKK
jgi:hypothetical protein